MSSSLLRPCKRVRLGGCAHNEKSAAPPTLQDIAPQGAPTRKSPCSPWPSSLIPRSRRGSWATRHRACAVACRLSVAHGSSHIYVVGAYARKGWQVIAVAGWGIGPIDSTHVGAYGPVIARVRPRGVIAGIVRRAIAII